MRVWRLKSNRKWVFGWEFLAFHDGLEWFRLSQPSSSVDLNKAQNQLSGLEDQTRINGLITARWLDAAFNDSYHLLVSPHCTKEFIYRLFQRSHSSIVSLKTNPTYGVFPFSSHFQLSNRLTNWLPRPLSGYPNQSICVYCAWPPTISTFTEFISRILRIYIMTCWFLLKSFGVHMTQLILSLIYKCHFSISFSEIINLNPLLNIISNIIFNH